MRKIVFEFSKFFDFVFQPGPSGIARVDLAFAQYLVENPHLFAAGLHDRLGIRTRFSLATLERLLHNLRRNWNEENQIPLAEKIEAWLVNPDPSVRRIRGPNASKIRILRGIGQLMTGWPWHNPEVRIPEGAIYLNTVYGNTDTPERLAWLAKRPDITPVFLVHDLIPFDFPEFFWNKNDQQFPRRIDTILRHAKIIIVTTESVREHLLRLTRERRGFDNLAIHVVPLAPANAFLQPVIKPSPALPPYFVMCGTIEPRKNHLLILNIWRRRLQAGLPVPKLLVIGQRGWKNENVTDILDRSPALAGNVLEVSELSTSEMARLVAGARAVLMPSFAEGFGLPVAEALALGTPVMASDIPVFREVSQGTALFLDPLDGPGWEQAIQAFSENSKAYAAAWARAASFVPQTGAHFFEGVMQAIGAG